MVLEQNECHESYSGLLSEEMAGYEFNAIPAAVYLAEAQACISSLHGTEPLFRLAPCVTCTVPC